MRIVARLFLFSWLMVFGGCGAEDHDHDHDHDHGHSHEGHDHDGHDHDHDGDDADAEKHGSGKGDGTGGGKGDGKGDKDGKNESGKAAPINTRCPLNPTEPVNEDATVSFGDKTVAFCCNKCASKFEKMTDEMKTMALAKVK